MFDSEYAFAANYEKNTVKREISACLEVQLNIFDVPLGFLRLLPTLSEKHLLCNTNNSDDNDIISNKPIAVF